MSDLVGGCCAARPLRFKGSTGDDGPLPLQELPETGRHGLFGRCSGSKIRPIGDREFEKRSTIPAPAANRCDVISALIADLQ